MAVDELLGPRSKKLKRMPHIFSQVLELPLPSDVPVEIEEKEDAFRFVVDGNEFVVYGTVKAEVVEIVPGVKKVVLRGIRCLDEDDLEEFDTWRFRLPPSAIADASFASCDDDGVLIVTVPKTRNGKDDNGIALNVQEDSVYQNEIVKEKGNSVSIAPSCPGNGHRCRDQS